MVIGRAFVIYGPGEDPRQASGEVSQFLRWHLNGCSIPAVGDVDQKTRDFVHVRDLIGGLLLIVERAPDGEIFNLGSGQEISLRQLAEAIGTITGREPELVADTSVTDDSYRLVADTAKLRDLGFRPQVPLHEGLEDLMRLLGESPELPSVQTTFQHDQSLAHNADDRR